MCACVCGRSVIRFKMRVRAASVFPGCVCGAGRPELSEGADGPQQEHASAFNHERSVSRKTSLHVHASLFCLKCSHERERELVCVYLCVHVCVCARADACKIEFS